MHPSSRALPRLPRYGGTRTPLPNALSTCDPHGLILAYHRIATTGVDPWQICVSPGHFAQQLKALSGFADVVPLPEFGERLEAARGGRPILAITFDEGYARACTTRPDLVFAGTDPWRLPRVGVLDLDGARFRRRLRREWLP